MKKNENVKNVYELAQERLAVLSRSLTIFMCHFRWKGQWSTAESLH